MFVRELPVDPNRSSAGKIVYKYNSSGTPKGIISTSYYIRTDPAKKEKDAENVKPAIYRTGILHYLKMTERPAFRGWRVVLYVDKSTLDTPTDPTEPMDEPQRTISWNQVLKHPNLILGCIHWPEYSMGKPNNLHIDNSLLRVMRYIAFWHYSSVPVLLRDADTLFENLIKRLNMVPQMETWERRLLYEMRKRKKPFLVATQPHYWRSWHVIPGTKIRLVGCYAGVTTSLGGIEEWVSGSLWSECLASIRSQSHRIKKDGMYAPSDEPETTYIGKDEQIIGHIILPALFKKTQIFYFEFAEVEGREVKDAELRKAGFTRYPSPYLESVGRGGETLLEPLKEPNETAEVVLLNPRLISLSMTADTDRILSILIERKFNRIIEYNQKKRKRTATRKRKREN